MKLANITRNAEVFFAVFTCLFGQFFAFPLGFWTISTDARWPAQRLARTFPCVTYRALQQTRITDAFRGTQTGPIFPALSFINRASCFRPPLIRRRPRLTATRKLLRQRLFA
ncbi:hypothetical protein [Paracoccus jeotgali]|uniref:hypothetical protein n=1 Tax=Paracoccus jeotgali TaxID=2065379 RepID=UPI0028AC8889|nr:hypothetical protein [Paracoccus jeotgali]